MVNPYRFYTYAYLREDRTPYYIGKGNGRRIYENKGRPCGKPKDENRIVFLKQNLTEEDAFKHEKYMIAVFGRKDLGTGILHNRTDGGEGISGAIRSEETRKKLREARKGKYFGKDNHFYGKTHSQETREKISKANAGRFPSEETREKISKANTGKTHSQETKIKMSKEKIGEKHHKSNYWKIAFADGRIIIQCGLYTWAKENGYNSSSIYRVHMGEYKKHKDIVAVEKLEQGHLILDALSGMIHL